MDSTQDSGSWDLGSTPRWRIILEDRCIERSFFVIKNILGYLVAIRIYTCYNLLVS